MLKLVALALPVLGAASLGRQSELEPERPGQESSLTRAVFADGRLWLLSDAGVLSSITEGAHVRVEERLPEPAVDLCLLDGRPLVITCKREDGEAWTLRRWLAGEWSVTATVRRERDDLLAVSSAAAGVMLLTTQRVIDVGRDGQGVVALSDPLGPVLVASILATPDQLFVGINAGEWGGGLRRIGRRSGKVTVIEFNASGALCGGPLNTECDPVHGIAPDPWKPGCIAAAIGLIHESAHGRIVEVCEDTVLRLFYAPYRGSQSDPSSGDDEPFETVAFFGLIRRGDALWAVGIDGVYRIGAGGLAQVTALPEFQEIGGIGVCFELPEIVLVVTSVNQRRALSGSVPILVPR